MGKHKEILNARYPAASLEKLTPRLKKWRKATLVINLLPCLALISFYIFMVVSLSRDNHSDSEWNNPIFGFYLLAAILPFVILIISVLALFAFAAWREPAFGALIYSGIAILGIYLITIHIYWLAVAIPSIVLAFVNTHTWYISRSITQHDNEHSYGGQS